MRRVRGIGFALLLLLLLAPACRAAPSPAPPPADGALVPVDGPGLLEQVRATPARLVLVNVWATWCAPCVAELPDLIRVGREFADRGLDLKLITVDRAADLPAAEAQLVAQGAPRPYYVKRGPDGPFIEAFDADWNGALPATALFDPDGELVAFWEGPLDYATLRDVLEVVQWP